VLYAHTVDVIVNPGQSFLTADAIENVVLKRGDRIIRPLARTVTPTTVQNAMGPSKTLAEGRFTFDMAEFSSSTVGTLTIVLIGKHGNFEWEMYSNELERLK
jgi:hypothetical protein